MSPPESEPTCAHHDGAPALAICAECGADICGECHRSDSRGFAVCPPCRGRSLASLPNWERPGEQYTPSAYASTLWILLRHPRSFFEDVSPAGRWIPAATFGYLSVVLGLIVDRIWKLALHPSFEASLSEYATTRSIPADELQWLLFLSVPLSALVVSGVHTAALKAATDVAGAELGWAGSARFAGYALGAFVLLIVPPVYGVPVGSLLAVFWLFNLEATALQHAFDFSPWKATLTATIPVLLALTCAGAG